MSGFARSELVLRKVRVDIKDVRLAILFGPEWVSFSAGVGAPFLNQLWASISDLCDGRVKGGKATFLVHCWGPSLEAFGWAKGPSF